MDRSAMAAVEFAIVAPVFLLFLFAIMGVGLDAFYQMTLDDAVRYAARQVQIDAPAAVNNANFAAAVCSEFGALAKNCSSSISFNVQATPLASGFSGMSLAQLSTTGTFPGTAANTAGFFSGTPFADNVNILVQVAYPLPFKLPYVSTLITETGTASIVTATTVRAEPY